MTVRSDLPMTRRHITIYDEDWDYLHRVYGKGTEADIGVSAAIRSIIHKKVTGIRARAEAEAEASKRTSK